MSLQEILVAALFLSIGWSCAHHLSRIADALEAKNKMQRNKDDEDKEK